MRIPASEEEIGMIVKSLYDKNCAYFIPDSFDSSIKYEGKKGTFAEFKKEFPYRGMHTRVRYRMLTKKEKKYYSSYNK